MSGHAIVTQTTVPRLYVIRHGETAWSLSGRHTGRTDILLTTRGQEAARAAGQRIRDIHFFSVLISLLQRARRPCELAGLGAMAEVEPGLAEWDYGDYEGKHSTDICKEHPGWSVFRDGCPGGETADQISARAGRLIARLATLAGNVALFTHGQFGCVLAMR